MEMGFCHGDFWFMLGKKGNGDRFRSIMAEDRSLSHLLDRFTQQGRCSREEIFDRMRIF